MRKKCLHEKVIFDHHCIFLICCLQKEKAGVFVRIQNESATSFANMKVANVSYGTIDASVTSGYKLISNPVYAAGCTATISDSSFYMGYGVCGTPPPPSFPAGRYTFVIKNSTMLPGYYDFEAKE